MGSTWVSEATFTSLLGEERAMGFVKKFGGTCMHIPSKASKNHRIAQEIGLIGMIILCRKYGGSSIDIPTGQRSNSKKAKIIELIELGLSLSEIAAQANVSTRYVSTVKKSFSMVM